MKKQFQSKSVPRGTRTIWRYLGALFILFTFAIGNVWAAASSVIPSSPDYKDISTVATSGTYTFTCSSSNITGAASATSSWIGWYSTNSSFKEYDKAGSATCMGEQTKIPNLKYDKVYFYVSNCTSFEIQAWGNGDNRHVNYSYQATDAASATADSFTSANNTTCASSGEIALNASKSYEIIVWNDAGEEIGVTYMVFNTSTGGGDPTPTTPTLEYNAGAYTIGATALDLSTLIKTKQSDGAITYSVKTDGGTSATISGKNFSATVAGTCVVTAAQAADGDTYLATSAEFNVVVSAAAPVVTPDVILNDNGTLNSTDFVTLVTSLDETDYTVESTVFDNNFKFGNTASAFVNKSWSNCYLAYDVKTTSATLKLYVYNKNSNSKNLYYQVLSETGNGDFKTESITSKGNGKIIEIPVTATKGTRVVFGANSTDVRICQLEVYENGTTLTKAGEVGYELALKGRPFATGSSNLFSGNIDGMEYVLYSELKLVNNNAYSVMRNNDGTHYFKIPAINDVQLKVTTENSAKFYVLGSAVAGDPDKDVQYGGEAGTFNVNLPHKDGYWYIIPVVAATGTGNEVRISKIAFATLPAGKHVTYSAGEGSVKEGKSLPTHADAWEGDKITLASGENLERGGYDFSGWKANGTGDLLKVGDKYTMTNDDVQFVAQWTEHIAKYGVKFMDGATKLDSLSVTIGEAPVFANPTKALNSFAGWKDGEDNVVTLSDLATSVTVEDTKLVLYAQWNKVYAADGTVNFADDNNSGALADFLPAGYACGNLDGSKNSVWGKESEGDVYFGYKLRHSGAYVELRVVANKRVTFTFGNYAQAGTIKVGEAAAETCTLTDSKYVVDTDAEAVIRFTTTSDGTVTLKSIMVGEIPALSDDATLSDLKVGGVTVDGFSASKLDYSVELPYGSTSQPAVTATPNDANVTSVVTAQTLASLDDATITVTAEDGVHYNVYTVHFMVAPKLGVELIKATHTGTTTASKEGYWTADVTVDKKTQSKKLGADGDYFGLTLADGKTFKNNDIVVIYLDPNQNPSAWLQLFKDKGTNMIANVQSGVKKGANYITLTGLPEEGIDKLYLYRTTTATSNMNPYVDYIAVYRLMAPFIEEFKIGDAVGTIDGTNIAVEVPYNADLEHLTPAIKYWANGNAQISPAVAEKDFSSAVEYTVSSSYAEDATGAYAPVTYTVTVTKEPHYVAKIGTTGYTSLAAALEHAADGEIVLLEDIDVTAQIEIAAGVTATIDLAGYKIEYTGTETLPSGVILVHNGASLTINDSSDPDAGKIVAGENAYAAVAMTKLGDDPANPAILIVNGGTLTGYYYGITGNGSRPNTQITINGGTINATATNDNLGIYHPQNGTLTVTGGTITGYASAIEMRAGTLVIEDGTFTATATSFSCNPNGSGTTTVGAAIAIAQHTTKTDITVTIEGGTFNGVKAINESNPQANDPAPQVDLDVTDGTFHGAIATVDVNNFISGGTFDNEVTADQCAEGYAPTSWTVGTETKYGVHLAGVIRAAAAQDANHGNAYAVTLDNGVVVISSNSDGKFDTNNQFDNSAADAAVALGADEGKYRYKGQHMLLKFPVNVNEFTIYSYDNNTTDRKINKVTVGDDPVNVKLKNNDAIGTYTFTNNTTTKLRTMTATMTDDEIIASDKYVYVGLSNAHTVFRILYTEAPCIDPVINSIDATRMKVGEQATVSVDASAVGATYQWYRCSNAAGDNAAIIPGATAASYSFTKAAGDEYFKVVVGCNCSAATVEDVVKAEEWYEVIRTNVTGYTEWSWNGVYDNETAGPTINQAQKGLVLASYIDAPNFDKLEGNNSAYVYRKNQYPAFQGTQLKFTTEVPGMLIIDASYTDNGNTFSVNGYPMGTLPKNHAKDTIAVKAGDVTITSQGIRIWAMTFDPDFSNYALTDNKASGYTRDVTEGRYGTICLENGGVMVGATLYEVAYYGETSKKIFFDEILNGTMEAGVPYIFLPNEGADKLAVFYTDEANASAGSRNGLIGYIGASEDPSDAAPVPAGVGNYILNNNQYREVVYENSAYVLSHRAYIKLAAINPTEPTLAPGRRRISMNVQQAEVATGMDNLYNGEQPMKVMIDGQMYILRGEKMYDATGRLVK